MEILTHNNHVWYACNYDSMNSLNCWSFVQFFLLQSVYRIAVFLVKHFTGEIDCVFAEVFGVNYLILTPTCRVVRNVIKLWCDVWEYIHPVPWKTQHCTNYVGKHFIELVRIYAPGNTIGKHLVSMESSASCNNKSILSIVFKLQSF